jgi:hypothetical protein
MLGVVSAAAALGVVTASAAAALGVVSAVAALSGAALGVVTASADFVPPLQAVKNRARTDMPIAIKIT